ncbi:hypothetical protein M514_11505 [Trichuris suis]|uniref:LIM zinc-binding domain-containing protein n=1 Tax=Trichuris suis TaxID=68888 RepID=A0A085LRP6_9BILA|nr:hypothetical protein M513_11505 [Trichuris suis]KFD72304.1 hypothetical protein M514_11505 [Trichuris suis]KHJ49317.1 LIM domain protein [Trichuris suis]
MAGPNIQNGILKYCAACKGQILGLTHYTDGQQIFHKSCLVCINCLDQLGDEEFYDVDGAHFCVTCYQEMYGLPCCKCDTAITSRTCYSVLGMNYHYNCLLCKNCKRVIELEPVYLYQKTFLCKKCIMGSKASPQAQESRTS